MNELVDWSLLLVTLRARSKLSLSEFARRVHSSEALLNRLARGETKDPRFNQGVALLAEAADYLTEEDWARVRKAA